MAKGDSEKSQSGMQRIVVFLIVFGTTTFCVGWPTSRHRSLEYKNVATQVTIQRHIPGGCMVATKEVSAHV